MSMALPPQRQNPLPPPPLSMNTNTPPPMDVASLVTDNNALPYPTPSSSSTNRPSLTLPPTSVPEPAPISTMDNGRIYSLDIVQQPVRARMCGFGDKVSRGPRKKEVPVVIAGTKVLPVPGRMSWLILGDMQDRRPITPPPCIRLVVKDAVTQEELEVNDIDTSFFVLTVDLWSADAQTEVNLVRHSVHSPSISATTPAAYPANPQPGDLPQPPPGYTPLPMQPNPTPLQQLQSMQQLHMAQAFGQSTQLPPTSMSMYPQMPAPAPSPYHAHQYPQQPQQYSQPYQPPPIPPLHPHQPGYWMNITPITPTGQLAQGQGPLLSPSALSTQSTDPRSNPSGMFSRNLIGSLCVSAFKLTDPENNLGVWFILQDLSVRTEGTFRLKISFINVGTADPSETLNTTTAPILASCFSEPFQVYSAKKFPGVIESTDLSKCFATQGIKIPIRKDGVRGNERKPGDGDDDDN